MSNAVCQASDSVAIRRTVSYPVRHSRISNPVLRTTTNGPQHTGASRPRLYRAMWDLWTSARVSPQW